MPAIPIPPFDLPIYIEQKDQSSYNEELSQTLRNIISSNGILVPMLTLIQVDALITLNLADPGAIAGLLFLNSDLNKLEFFDVTGTPQVITSI